MLTQYLAKLVRMFSKHYIDKQRPFVLINLNIKILKTIFLLSKILCQHLNSINIEL